MRRLAVVMASAAALLAAAPGADARTEDFAKPILLVAEQSCGSFDRLETALTEYTTSVGGKKIGFSGSTECVAGQDGPKLAAHIESTYKGKPIDVVAYGEAGLAVRAALTANPKLVVEDVVTLGTPHDAPAAAGLGKNPQGAGGTEWSAIGSEADTVVSADSAVAMDAAHKTIYKASMGLTHEKLLTDISDAGDAKIRYSHGGGRWIDWNNGPHVSSRVAENLIFGGGETVGACELEETQPQLCDKTPVILVPGFGASELSCTYDGRFQMTWPNAIIATNGLWGKMELGRDGASPADPSDQCNRTVTPTGKALPSIFGATDIHAKSVAWLNKIAPGHFYEFGWDFRKGPDQTLERLDQFIDRVRARHGASRVTLVAHSYGGLLSRWYIDEPGRAKKVARVANFGSPHWGAPKAWFAMAYGYESPSFSELDLATPDSVFKSFAKNLTGLYYLLPPEAWFKNAPAELRNWLEVDDKPITGTYLVADQIRAFGGNSRIADEVAANQKKHISGFKRTNGVDWRIFVGSGVAALGHVRAYSGTRDVQYSWVNGDGTVPLISQRQSATTRGKQLGDKTPTYNFCEVPHMEEMERENIQNAVTPFIVSGHDPIVDGKALWGNPCELEEREYIVTGDEDTRSIELSKAVPAGAASARARASQAPAERLSLQAAEAAGLVELIDDGRKRVFVPTVPVTIHFGPGSGGTVQTAPITGDGRRGASTVYDIPAAGMDVASRGTQAVAVATGGGVLKGRKADTTAPRTTVKVRRAGQRRILTASAKDPSGVAVTMVQVGKARPKPWKKSLKVSKRATVRFWSVDTLGNAERHRKVKLR